MTTRYIRMGWIGDLDVRDDMYSLFRKMVCGGGKLYNDAPRKVITKDILNHYNMEDIKTSVIRIIQYYKLKAYNKISYDTNAAIDIMHAAILFPNLIWGEITTFEFEKEDMKLDITYHDTIMTLESARKFITGVDAKLSGGTSNDKIRLEMLRDIAIDLYNKKGYDEIPKDLEVAYLLLNLPKVYNIKNKELITHEPNIAYPIPRLSYHDGVRYPRIKMNKLQIKKAVLFGSMSKCIEETIEAYLENNPDNFIKEVTDIYITRYHMELRRDLLKRKLISLLKEDTLIYSAGIYVRDKISFSDTHAMEYRCLDWIQNIGLSYSFGSDVGYVGAYQDLKGWHFRLETSKDEDDFSKDTFNILMYFKDKTDKEM